MTDADLNALDFAFLSRPEFYIPSVLSFIGLTILYFMTFHLLMPLVVNPNFEHIQKSEKLQFKIATSIIGLVNGLCIGYVSLIWLYDIVAFTITEENASAETTKAQRVWLSIGIGYFCYDIVVFCVVGSLRYIGRVDKVYIVHHSMCILIWGLSIISVYGGQVSMIVIWLHEWTNPLLAAILFQSYFTRNRKEYNALRMQFMLKLSYFVTFNVCIYSLFDIDA